MMKLAFVLFRYFPQGGLQQDFLKILKACMQRDAEITVFTMEWQGAMVDGVTTRVIPGRGFTALARRHSFDRQFKKEIELNSFDRVLGFNRLPGLDYYYAADSCFAAKAFGERNIFYRLAPRSRQYLQWEQAVFGNKSSTQIMLISPLQKKQYLKYYPKSASRLVDLPPGIKKDRKAEDNAETLRVVMRSELGITCDATVILQIGAYFKGKGVERSLRAIASLRTSLRHGMVFVLVGNDNPDWVWKLAKSLGLEDQLKILPECHDIPALLQAADLMLHPSHSESAGMVLLESVIAGLPVLTTDTCGYAFYVEQAKAGMVCTSPFKQPQLDSYLQQMIESLPNEQWRENGILFGRSQDLYHMPERVAELLMRER